MKAPAENGQRRNTNHKPTGKGEAQARQRWHGPFLISLLIWAAVFVPPILAVAHLPPRGGPGPRLTLTVIIYNYAHVSASTLRRAQDEAGRIIRGAGGETTWVDCAPPGLPVAPAQQSRQWECGHRPFVGAMVVLRIQNGSSYGSVSGTAEALGFSAGSDLASVLYDHVAAFAELNDEEGDAPEILGDVIAHEIGHLLLGPHAHSPSGIMRGRWDEAQARLAVAGRLIFTREQSARLQATLRNLQGEPQNLLASTR